MSYYKYIESLYKPLKNLDNAFFKYCGENAADKDFTAIHKIITIKNIINDLVEEHKIIVSKLPKNISTFPGQLGYECDFYAEVEFTLMISRLNKFIDRLRFRIKQNLRIIA